MAKLKINENDLARRVAKAEGGKKSLSIGQVKEVQKLILEDLADNFDDLKGVIAVLELINKHR